MTARQTDRHFNRIPGALIAPGDTKPNTIMQTIKINIEQSLYGYDFCNGNLSIASIREYKRGTFDLMAAHKPYGSVDSLTMAFEVLGDKIEALFGALGLNVEFVNA